MVFDFCAERDADCLSLKNVAEPAIAAFDDGSVLRALVFSHTRIVSSCKWVVAARVGISD
jgi:hypothetical protein